jgi:PEP-CTERM motif
MDDARDLAPPADVGAAKWSRGEQIVDETVDSRPLCGYIRARADFVGGYLIMGFTKHNGRALVCGLIGLALAGGANAATMFGPASGDVAVLGSPSVMLGPTSGSESYNLPVQIFSTTGSLTAATGPGTVMGTLTFSNVDGITLPETIPNFLTFTDSSGGTFNFDVASVKTVSYSSQPGVETSISLYLLGTAGDAHLGLTPSPTSVTITANQTGMSAFSASASISAPPSGTVPEPAAWALMVLGVGMVGAMYRRTVSAKTLA